MITAHKEHISFNLRGDWETKIIYLDDVCLDPEESQKVWNHSPDGFNWGYRGSGPAQLALAILMKFMPNADAIRLHQRFKDQVVANLPSSDFNKTITWEYEKT